ncbi:MAG: hypothetical protein LBI59_05195 [Candidatus Accumulibacter sp.]|jgi:hypothetical protein|nr:hypothetical protein [Accumulibacter sp.]
MQADCICRLFGPERGRQDVSFALYPGEVLGRANPVPANRPFCRRFPRSCRRIAVRYRNGAD